MTRYRSALRHAENHGGTFNLLGVALILFGLWPAVRSFFHTIVRTATALAITWYTLSHRV